MTRIFVTLGVVLTMAVVGLFLHFILMFAALNHNHDQEEPT